MAETRKAPLAFDLDEIERHIKDTATARPAAPAAEPPRAAAPALDPRLEQAMRSLEDLLRESAPHMPLPRREPAAPPLPVEAAVPPAAPEPAAYPPDHAEPVQAHQAYDPVPTATTAPAAADWAQHAADPLADDGRGRPVDFDELGGRLPVAERPGGHPPAATYAAPADHAAPEAQPYDEYGAAAYEPPTATEAPAEPPRRQRRKAAFIAATVLGVAAVGVAGAMTFRGGPSARLAGAPPLIKAEQGPTKVEPRNPGGLDIPNQNRQILQKAADTPPGSAKVVTSEEQPVDVKALVQRDIPPRTILPPPGTRVARPNPPAQPVDSTGAVNPPTRTASVLGEPRKVRTVTIRAEELAQNPAAQPPAAAPPAAPVTRSVRPTAAPAVPPAPTQAAPVTPPPAAPAKPERVALAPPPAAPAAKPETPAAPPAATPPATRPSVTPPAQAETPPAKPKATARAAQKPRTAAEPEAPPSGAPLPISPGKVPRAPVRTAAIPAQGGDLSVQFASATSEAEAREQISRLKARFSELASHNPTIAAAQVNGQTRYRVRVGGLNSGDALSLCNGVRKKGGACFLSRN